MIKYERVFDIDDELYYFHIKQQYYYQIEGEIVTRESLKEGMQGPEQCDESQHFCIKIKDQERMIGYIDYQYGYRYHSDVNNDYVWIGLFLVDESIQRGGWGRQLITHFLHEFQQNCHHVQLACMKENQKGMAFWPSMGFYAIDTASWNNHEVIVMQYDL